MGVEERRGREEPQRVHEAGRIAQAKASTGLRSTRTTARQRDVPDDGKWNAIEPELLLKTHLAGRASGARFLDLQYTCALRKYP